MSHDTNDEESSDVVETSTSTVRHSWQEPFEPSVTVIEAVAAATGQPTTDLPPLQDYVDPDALDTLITLGESAGVSVSFSYAGTVVTITADGTIEVDIDHG